MSRMLAIATIFAAACGSPKVTPKKQQPPITPPIDAAPVVVIPRSNAVIKKVPMRAMIEAPHAGAIKAIGLTADGSAAITCDDQDGLRLWPTLDGSKEPRLVDLPAPRSIALGKLGDGFLVAILDDVGGMVIATLDADGRTLQRATLEPDPAFTGVVMTPLGPLGWRADHSMVQLDKDGTIIAYLAVGAGERLVTIALSGDHAIAVLETASGEATKRRARRLVLATGASKAAAMSWGDSIELGTDLGSVVAISPNGKRLATLLLDKPKNAERVVVFDLVAKKVIANQAKFATRVGFVDDDHLALVQPNTFEWIDLAHVPENFEDTSSYEPFVNPARAEFGVGGGRLVAPRNDELAIARPSVDGLTQFLGYALESPSVASVGASGRMLIGLGETFALLDHDLREVGKPDALVPKGSTISELRWLGADDWLVETSSQNDGKTALAVVDIAKDQRTQLRSGVPVAQLVMYEPTTHLVTFSLGDAPEVARWSPDKRTLDKVLTLPKPNGFEQRELVPVAPSLANSTQLVSIQMRDRTTLRWVTQPTAIDTGPSIIIDGSLAGVDRAGHVFVWQNGADHKLALAIFEAGKQIGTLPTEGPTTIWPDPKGQQVIEISSRGVSLVGLDGSRKWTLAIQGATEALWLDDGTLALVAAAGLARIDPVAGTITATRCGWRFGLSPVPHPFNTRIEPICVQQR